MKQTLTAVLTLATLALSAMGGEMRDYTFVFIRTGPATGLSREVQQEAFQGHFSNMTRMAEEGDLLIAGPFMPPMSAPDLRGLWIFETDSTEHALELAATDPPGKLGIFVFEAHVLRTDDPILESPRLEKEDEEKRLADPEIPDEWEGRPYVLALSKEPETQAPERVDGVLMIGTLIDVDGEDMRLVLLDAAAPDAATEVLRDAGCDPVAWTIQGWYSSKTHTQLPSLRD